VLLLVLAALLLVPSAFGKDRGMAYAHALQHERGYGTAASAASLEELRALGVDSVALTPFGFQANPGDTTIRWVGTRVGHGIGETDEAIRAGAKQARAAGMRIMLKPHLWLRPPNWPGSIDMQSAADWDAWFASYRPFLLHYAALAEELHAETLCVGNELTKTVAHEQAWRALIRNARAVYHGRLTYGANLDEVYAVPFWDALDAIGVSAYFPLSDERSPDVATLERGWKPLVAKLAALSAKTKRPILFTELGYPSRDFAAKEPWVERGREPNTALQAAAYEAFFRAVWPQRWFAGVYFWKWESYAGHDDGGVSYFIEKKPAAAIVRRYFTHR
jgi:hypothetical protein